MLETQSQFQPDSYYFQAVSVDFRIK